MTMGIRILMPMHMDGCLARDYYSGGRPPIRWTAAIITRAGARPSARRRRFSLARAPAHPLDGGDYHSGGRPPARSTAAILTRAGARPSAGRRRFSLGRVPVVSLVVPVLQPIFSSKNSGKFIKSIFRTPRTKIKLRNFYDFFIYRKISKKKNLYFCFRNGFLTSNSAF